MKTEIEKNLAAPLSSLWKENKEIWMISISLFVSASPYLNLFNLTPLTVDIFFAIGNHSYSDISGSTGLKVSVCNPCAGTETRITVFPAI